MKDVIINTKRIQGQINTWRRKSAQGLVTRIGVFDKKYKQFTTRNGTKFVRKKGDDVTYSVYEFEIDSDAIAFADKFSK